MIERNKNMIGRIVCYNGHARETNEIDREKYPPFGCLGLVVDYTSEYDNTPYYVYWANAEMLESHHNADWEPCEYLDPVEIKREKEAIQVKVRKVNVKNED